MVIDSYIYHCWAVQANAWLWWV